jgi:hypothetical protein
MLLLLGGCTVVDREVIDVYSRAEINAINAEMSCKLMARNLVQIERCKRGN